MILHDIYGLFLLDISILSIVAEEAMLGLVLWR
jgi:hypothetical protein